MTEISDNKWIGANDLFFMKTIGAFIKHHRLQQNKTQVKLAKEAGIARSTLSLFEKGQNTSIIVFIQLLRALNLLSTLKEFEVKQQISPIQLAKMEKSKRIRAGSVNKKISKTKSKW